VEIVRVRGSGDAELERAVAIKAAEVLASASRDAGLASRLVLATPGAERVEPRPPDELVAAPRLQLGVVTLTDGRGAPHVMADLGVGLALVAPRITGEAFGIVRIAAAASAEEQ
jgi:hypothetical protein